MGRGIKIKGITLLLLICILGYWHHTIPEYKIKSSISMENPTERQTILRVIVYKNYYAEDLPGKIEQFFVELNGKPTTLQIELYFDEDSKPYKIVNFEYPADH